MSETTNPTWSAATTWSSEGRPGPPASTRRPVLRREVLDAYGPSLVRLCNAVSAQLTTTELTRLNLQVADGQPATEAASAWLRAHTIIG